MNSEQLQNAARHNIEQSVERTVNKIQKEISQQGNVDCDHCGDKIEASRRTAIPSATSCLDCQQRLERERKPYGR